MGNGSGCYTRVFLDCWAGSVYFGLSSGNHFQDVPSCLYEYISQPATACINSPTATRDLKWCSKPWHCPL